jgi:hypothetical protein
MASLYHDSPIRTFATSTSTDLSGSQFLIVKLDTSNDNQVLLSTSATDPIAGVLLNKPLASSGDEAVVLLLGAQGTGKVVAGGTLTISEFLTTNSSGQAISTTSSGNRLIGTALHAASAGQIVEFAIGGTDRY